MDEVASDQDEEDKGDDSMQESYKLSFPGTNARVVEDWYLRKIKVKSGQENSVLFLFCLCVFNICKDVLYLDYGKNYRGDTLIE